jgi:hypothetical protein
LGFTNKKPALDAGVPRIKKPALEERRVGSKDFPAALGGERIVR